MKTTPLKKTYSYLALGDSYTVGEGVPQAESFPYQVVRQLLTRGIKVDAPDIVAKTGWTTDELEAALKMASLKKKYDLVTLLIGVNNQYRKRTVETYIPEFESLLQQAIAFAGNIPGHVIVLSIPDWSVTPFAEGTDIKKIAAEIDSFNKSNKTISQNHGVHYVDITPGTREAKTDRTLLAQDWLHPSGKEYAKWADLIVLKINISD